MEIRSRTPDRLVLPRLGRSLRARRPRSISASIPGSPHARATTSPLVAAVICTALSNGKSATPRIEKSTGRGAARSTEQMTRTASTSPGDRESAVARRRFTSICGRPPGPAATRSEPAVSVQGRRIRASAAISDKTIARPWADVSASTSRTGTASSTSGRASSVLAIPAAWARRGPPTGAGSVAVTLTSNPTLSSRGAERDYKAVREQQHVEEKGPDGGDTQDPDPGAPRLTDEAPGSKRERPHRRVKENASRRSSVHDAATAAATPRGTAIAIDRSAIVGVIRTNTSAVSYRHWKNRLMPP